jgi:hypothetical protein
VVKIARRPGTQTYSSYGLGFGLPEVVQQILGDGMTIETWIRYDMMGI